MFIWQSKERAARSGTVITGQELAKNMGGGWFQLNVDHNLVTHTIKGLDQSKIGDKGTGQRRKRIDCDLWGRGLFAPTASSHFGERRQKI